MKLNRVSKVIEKSVLCQLCGKRFKTESWKRHHILMSHTNELEPCKEDGRFHCPLCPKRYKNMNSRSHHIVKTHFGQSTNESSILQCHLCKDTFANAHTLNWHLKLHAIHNSKTEINDINMLQNISIGMNTVTNLSLFANMSAEEFDYSPNNSAPAFAFSQLPNNDQVLGIQNINNQTLGSFNINLQATEELANSEANLWDTPEKSLPSIITPGQIAPGNSTWSTPIEQKQLDVGFYNNFPSIMALSDSGMYPGSELNNHCIGIPGSLNTHNLLINFSSQQLCDMSAPSPGELFPMPNMYGPGTSQAISPANNYCFSIPSLNATILGADTAHQKMLCARNMESFRNSVKFSGQPTLQHAQQFYKPDQLTIQKFPTIFANSIALNSL